MLDKVKAKMRTSKYLAWAADHKDIWVFKRHNVALGAAIGVGMGILIPLAQIPASAALSVLLRANVGVATLATFVTNPLTVGPLYYAAFRFGEKLTGIGFTPLGSSGNFFQWISGVGAPTIVGLGVFAVVGFLLTYSVVYGLFGVRSLFEKRPLSKV